jgi:Na+-driven multidrug efflux pump
MDVGFRNLGQVVVHHAGQILNVQSPRGDVRCDEHPDFSFLKAGQRLLTRSFAYMSVGLGIMVMTVMGVLMFVFAPELMAVMSPVEEIVAQGAAALRIEAFAEPMFAATIVANGVFIGAGDTIVPAIMSLSSMWLVRLTLAASLAPTYGLRGVWTAMAIELTFRGVIFLVRLFSGKWNKKI